MNMRINMQIMLSLPYFHQFPYLIISLSPAILCSSLKMSDIIVLLLKWWDTDKLKLQQIIKAPLMTISLTDTSHYNSINNHANVKYYRIYLVMGSSQGE